MDGKKTPYPTKRQIIEILKKLKEDGKLIQDNLTMSLFNINIFETLKNLHEFLTVPSDNEPYYEYTLDRAMVDIFDFYYEYFLTFSYSDKNIFEFKKLIFPMTVLPINKKIKTFHRLKILADEMVRMSTLGQTMIWKDFKNKFKSIKVVSRLYPYTVTDRGHYHFAYYAKLIIEMRKHFLHGELGVSIINDKTIVFLYEKFFKMFNELQRRLDGRFD